MLEQIQLKQNGDFFLFSKLKDLFRIAKCPCLQPKALSFREFQKRAKAAFFPNFSFMSLFKTHFKTTQHGKGSNPRTVLQIPKTK
jgi:hypothetical protein